MIAVISFIMLMLVNYCIASVYVRCIKEIVSDLESEILWCLFILLFVGGNLSLWFGIHQALLLTLSWGPQGIAYMMATLLSIGMVVYRIQTLIGIDKMAEKLKA